MNVSKGDLVIILRAQHPENVGKIVEVVEFREITNGKPTWYLEHPTGIKTDLGLCKRGWCYDTDLRRITNPDKDLSETTNKEKLLEIT